MTPRARSPLALFLPSLDGGGAERAILNLAAGFSKRGFPVDIVLAISGQGFGSELIAYRLPG